jgi:hypothetical protein
LFVCLFISLIAGVAFAMAVMFYDAFATVTTITAAIYRPFSPALDDR